MTKKYIELILNQKIEHLGQSGEVIRVSMGYARNYLLPENKASRITSATIKQIKASQKKYSLLKQEEHTQALKLKSILETIYKFTIKKVFNKTGQIFGSVSEKDICKSILDNTGQNIYRSQVMLPTIKNIGNYPVKVNLSENIVANLEVQVLPEI
jgi:large subunit ribosomal protein L9